MNVLRSSITPVVSPSLVWTDMEKRAFLSTRMMGVPEGAGEPDQGQQPRQILLVRGVSLLLHHLQQQSGHEVVHGLHIVVHLHDAVLVQERQPKLHQPLP